MRRTDHLGGITAFVTTAQQGSFTAAAEKLGLTKSAIGKSVSRLEDRLGLKLFQRSTRRLSLTPDGERFLTSCQSAIDILEQAEAEMTSHTCQPSGRLRVDLPAAFGRQRILPILLDITRRYPELALTVTFSERFVDLIDEGIDLVVRIGELADSSGLVARRLTTQKLVICASPDYLLYHGEPVSIDELNQHQCVVGFRRNQPVSWLLKESDGHINRLIPPPTHEFADGDAMLAATLADGGLSQLPLWLVGKYLDEGKLREVLPGHSGGEMPISALWPKSRQLLPKIRYAVDTLVRAAEDGLLD
ncbi:LysR substrate-binding domain-containing protein [Enterobacter hormaechei]|uniref:LysR substrate-binding domain-containing protein n=1 Tax=Enterobacterales TaxID=91347 RepID=UPI000C9A4715|nr:MULTISPECIES: LysR substrate-binding domain-containing protein [Enterobacterales]MCU2309574.1 LysR substrate-binding domain-containing protein [Enterobacter hormaechei subsp. hormaechei]UAS95437.1 LysR family transcriptional regulator [Enterobacter cloacae complex sp.]HCW3116499.1 LysR family transcriptional regulator [Citrobacter amalonaticus]EFH8134335.1 LysR family transcriptional regulator [Escherichia coli]EKV5350460.1 LysR family transcriptional regulator [Enterobacter hormaechei]